HSCSSLTQLSPLRKAPLLRCLLPPATVGSPSPVVRTLLDSVVDHAIALVDSLQRIRKTTTERDSTASLTPAIADPPEIPLHIELVWHARWTGRRKSLLARPSLTRTKGYSTNTLPRNPELPPFRFGAGSSKLSTSTSMSLGECFMESPPQERRPHSANSPSVSIMGPPRPSRPFGSMNGLSFRNGSPIGNHTRRPSNPLIRPRKQFRRSLSMFEHPGDRMIVDCRFEYEFDGGHIDGAVNYNDKELLTGDTRNCMNAAATVVSLV
ncbi:hypothetical protein BUE80_DR013714, partial [Diplocarpon rosae]